MPEPSAPYVYNSTPHPGDYFLPEASYQFTVEGSGSMGAMSETLQSPGHIGLIQPDANAPLSIDPQTGVDLQWTPSQDNKVFVNIVQSNPNRQVTCAFDNDGSGHVPPAALTELSSGSADFYIGTSIATSLPHPTLLDVPVAPVMHLFASGYLIPAELL
jgi:hypothetical protein